MTDDAGRTTPEGSDPAQPPPQPYPPQAYPAQAYAPQPYPPQGYPPHAYPPQGYPQSQFPPQPYPPEVYSPQAQPLQAQSSPGQPLPAQSLPGQPPQPPGYPSQYPPAGGPAQGYPPQAYPPPDPSHPHRAGPVRPPGERRTAGLVVGGLAGILALAAVGVGVVALRGSEDGDGRRITPVAAPRLVTPGNSPPLTPSTETPTPDPSAPDPSPTEPSGGSTPSPARSSDSHVGSSVALSKGDCIEALPKGQNILTVTLVPCTAPHEAQVGSTFSPTGTAYPGGGALEAIVRSECPIRLSHAISSDAPALSWTGYYPEAVEWEGGDHSIKCLVIARNGKPLTRSVIG